MEENPSLEELTRKLGELAQRQQEFSKEITDLQKMVYELKRKEIGELKTTQQPLQKLPPELKKEAPAIPVQVPQQQKAASVPTAPVAPKVKKEKTPIEEFIGTNLLNKVGIAVLVIGIAIVVKYAIDNDKIGEVGRIVLGYLCGVILIGIALRLKAKYENFSAVILSGGMAVLYFMTFATYDFYHRIPQLMAFILMVVFTAFTVYASIQYNLRVIAIFGLVGAYAVPFLLSDGSGKAGVMFAYMAVINTGILILAFKKNWKQLYYTAFILTWIIYTAWYFDRYTATDHLALALGFSTIFFITFYGMILSYKLIAKESLTRWDVVILLINSFIYFGFGYDAINDHQAGEMYLGAFTVFNAVLHFISCFIIYKRQDQTRDIFFFAAGLVLVFLTLAVPVQLNGNWVTIVWAGEAALLFWIGRSKKYPVYERLSYPLIAMAFISLGNDWSEFYDHYSRSVDSYVRPVLNVQFLTTMLVCVAFGLIARTNSSKKYESPYAQGSLVSNFLWGALPALFILTLYVGMFLEIKNYWGQRYDDQQISVYQKVVIPLSSEDSQTDVTTPAEMIEYDSLGNEIKTEIAVTEEPTAVEPVYVEYESVYHSNADLLMLRNLWLLNYSAIFIMVLAFINFRFLKNVIVGYVLLGASGLVLFVFITSGLLELKTLLYNYVNDVDSEYFYHTGNVLIRYVTLAFMVPLLWINYRLVNSPSIDKGIRIADRIFFHIVVLAILSSELLSWLALASINNSDKLMLSILWGAYALSLVVYGLMKDLKYLRISAITLFGVTLIKLFFYDMSGMGTISKTVVMMILGALLLVASFLYNKFKKSTDATKN